MNDKLAREEQEFLAQYDIHQFDVPLLTIDVVIFTIIEKKLKVLLTFRPDHPCKGQWAVPGGFVNINGDSDLQAAARRKLQEKTGVETPYLEQLETVGNGQRDPRGWSVTVVYFALIDSHHIQLAETPPARWVDHDDETLDHLAFDHSHLVRNALKRLRNKVAYSTLPVHLLPDTFTLAELQEVYEIVLEQKIEKSAFRRRVKAGDFVEALEGQMRLGSNRPAQLFKFRKESEGYYFNRNL